MESKRRTLTGKALKLKGGGETFNDPDELNVYRPPEEDRKLIRILALIYEYEDGTPDNIKNSCYLLKKYYEKLGPINQIELRITYRTVELPDVKKVDYQKAFPEVKKSLVSQDNAYECFIHFCCPRVSHTPGKHILTAATGTNVIHEFGHFLGLTHAMMVGPKGKLVNKDQFSQMTSGKPYQCPNSIHMIQLGFFGSDQIAFYELTNSNEPIIFELQEISDFESDFCSSIKVIRAGAYYISMCNKLGFNFIVIHSRVGTKTSCFETSERVEDSKKFSFRELEFEIIKASEISCELLIKNSVLDH